nr:MAG TPA: distal tail protein [Caudoviricetes sp.]
MVLMKFNGKDLSDLITIQEVLRNVGNERVLSTNDAPDLGVNVLSVKTGAKIIKVNFYMRNKFNKYALNQDKHTLAGIFHVDKPVRIEFDDEPDKYYMGYVQGIPDIEDPIAWLSVLSIELLIPDGVAHSSTYREFTDYTFVDGEVDINSGTNLLSGGDGPFKPQRDLSTFTDFDNYQYYLGTSVTLEKGKRYIFGGKTDGEFTNIHDTKNESNRVLVYICQYDNATNTQKNFQIISSPETATKGSGFRMNQPSGNYIIRVNSYHRKESLLRSVWDLRIIEAGETFNKVTIPILNNGTVDALPIITINSTADNGYYGFVNETGIFSCGDVEEEDNYIRYDQVIRAQYMGSGYVPINKMINGVGPFRPNSSPVNDFDNKEVYTNSKIYLENGKNYKIKAKTDGAFTNVHNQSVESDNVVLWFVNNSASEINKIVSSSTTGTTGTTFTWEKPDGWYYLKVNTYHKTATHAVESVEVTGVIGTYNVIDQAYRDSLKNVAVLNDVASSLTWGQIQPLDFWGRRHLGQIQQSFSTQYLVSSMTYEIEPTLSEYVWWRNIFEVASENEYGTFKVTFSDEEGNFLYGVEVIKKKKGLAATYNLLGADGHGGVVVVEGFDFALNQNNPLDSPRGFCDITRDNEKIKLYTFGAYKNYTWDQIKEVKTARVHFTWYAFQGKTPITRNYLDDLLIVDKKGTIMEQSPNRYFKGSKLIVNSEDNSIQQNGIYDISQKTIGSDFIKIPPGESELEIYLSSWSLDIPEITVKFEERYI